MNIKGHFETITRHKLLVMKYCFECGLYQQGLTHDLSKYSPTEFIPGCIYYQGDHSPNEAERAARGYSSAWLHHKGRNKHHLEYWIDYTTNKSGLGGMKMPLRYVCEMVCDRVAASQIYLGDKYTDASPWQYYEKSKDHYLLHPETRALLEKLLLMVRDLGQERTFAYIRFLLGCEDNDPDKVIPDIDTANVVDTVNHMAADSKEGLGQVYYSAKYSEITKELLNNWLENREKSVTYAEEYQKIVAKMGGNAKIVVGLTDKNVIPGLTSGNPAVKSSAKYDVLFKDTSAYNLADRIGVAFVKTENGTVYQLVCLFDVN